MPLNLDPRVLAALQGQANQDPRKALEKEILQRYLQKLQSDRADPQQIAMQRQDQMGKEDLSILGSASRGFDEAASKMGGTRPSASIAKQAGELRQDSQKAASVPGLGSKGIDPSVLNYLAKKKGVAPKWGPGEYDRKTGEKRKFLRGESGEKIGQGVLTDSDQWERDLKIKDIYFKQKPIAKARAVEGELTKLLATIDQALINNNGPSDSALIKQFEKFLDPGSVVREAEFAQALKSGGVIAQLEGAVKNFQGKGFLTNKVRKDIGNTVSKLWEAIKGTTIANADADFAKNYGKPPQQTWIEPKYYEYDVADQKVSDLKPTKEMSESEIEEEIRQLEAEEKGLK